MEFTLMVARLIDFIYSNGMEATGGEWWRHPHMQVYYLKTGYTRTKTSKHTQRLAQDLNLFIDGKYTANPEDYRSCGEYWESIHPENLWGGRFSIRPEDYDKKVGWDSGHFESFSKLRDRRGKKWFPYEKDRLKYFIKRGFVTSQIACLLGREIHSVHHQASRIGISLNSDQKGPKIYKVNSNYFSQINWEEKAYVLGFIFADGSISKGKGRNRLEIGLHPKDIDILQKIKNELSYSGLIYKKPDKVKLYINDEKLVNDLISLGATPKKSLTARFPLVPEGLIRHFIRGFFDGDGYITKSKKGLRAGITSGSPFILEHINKYSSKYCNAIGSIEKYKDANAYKLVYWCNQAMSFLDWIYSDNKISLDRKQKIYTECNVRKNHRGAWTTRLILI